MSKIKPSFDEETQKKLKAFEIMNTKDVDILLLKESINYRQYNWYLLDEHRFLPQEEYELLKEVLI